MGSWQKNPLKKESRKIVNWHPHSITLLPPSDGRRVISIPLPLLWQKPFLPNTPQQTLMCHDTCSPPQDHHPHTCTGACNTASCVAGNSPTSVHVCTHKILIKLTLITPNSVGLPNTSFPHKLPHNTARCGAGNTPTSVHVCTHKILKLFYIWSLPIISACQMLPLPDPSLISPSSCNGSTTYCSSDGSPSLWWSLISPSSCNGSTTYCSSDGSSYSLWSCRCSSHFENAHWLSSRSFTGPYIILTMSEKEGEDSVHPHPQSWAQNCDESVCQQWYLLMQSTVSSEGQRSTVKPEGQARSTVRPEGQVRSTVKPEGQARSTVKPEGQACSTVRPEGQARSTVRPEGQARSTVKPEGQARSKLKPEGQARSHRHRSLYAAESQQKSRPCHPGIEAAPTVYAWILEAFWNRIRRKNSSYWHPATWHGERLG